MVKLYPCRCRQRKQRQGDGLGTRCAEYLQKMKVNHYLHVDRIAIPDASTPSITERGSDGSFPSKFGAVAFGRTIDSKQLIYPASDLTSSIAG